MLYILKDKKPVSATVQEWAEWNIEGDKHILKQTLLTNDVYVSTIFIGLSHSYQSVPLNIFETMGFFAGEIIHQAKADTWDEAMDNHNEFIAGFEAAIKTPLNWVHYTIYKDALDYPNGYVLRKYLFIDFQGQTITIPEQGPAKLFNNLTDARNDLPNGTFHMLSRSEEDHPSVIETWM